MAPSIIRNCREFHRTINNGRIVLVSFYADWSACSQLPDLSETFERIGVDLCRVNVDEADDVALEADVRVVPTFMVFKDGNKVGYAEGVGAGRLHTLMGPHIAARTEARK